MRTLLLLAVGASVPPCINASTVQCPDGSPPPCAAPSSRAAAAPARGSIAAFPFANRSPDSTDAYLAEALPEQIIGRLARVRGVQVKSATVVNAQWRRTPDPMAAARSLRVEWFVTGSIRRAGGQLAVSAELVRSGTGDGAWSAAFRRTDGDLAAVEEQIAESVAVAIVGQLAPGQTAALRRTPPADPEAYRLYLQGRSLLARRTAADIARAAQVLEVAVQRDPSLAPAWARLAMARGLQVQWGGSALPADSLIQRSRAAAERALALDSGLAEGWMVRGQLGYLTGRLDVSQQAFTRALRIDSLSADAWHMFGYLYGADFLSMPDVGTRYFRRALALDPELRNSWRHMALLSRNAGRLAEAEAMLDSTQLQGPWASGLGERSFVRYLRGDLLGALADLTEWDRLGGQGVSVGVSVLGLSDPGPGAALLRAVYQARLGDSALALSLFEPARTGTGFVAVRAHLMLALALGRRLEALTALQRVRDQPLPGGEPRCGPAPCSASLWTWSVLQSGIAGPLKDEPLFLRLLEETRPRVPWLE